MTAALPTPSERLALSRERLRTALAQQMPARGQDTGAPEKRLLDTLQSVLPGASILIDALGHWWTRHPLHTSGLLASGVAQNLLRPLAQRYPVRLVAGAVVLGAVLAFSRPWRWGLRPQLLGTLGPALLSSVLASAAVQSWLAAALSKEPAVSE